MAKKTLTICDRCAKEPATTFGGDVATYTDAAGARDTRSVYVDLCPACQMLGLTEALRRMEREQRLAWAKTMFPKVEAS